MSQRRYPMGEVAAPDQYHRQVTDSDVARALQQAGPGMAEDQAYEYPRFPDAASERQRPPPAPPFFDDNTPDWATAPGETPDYLIRDPMREPEDDSA